MTYISLFSDLAIYLECDLIYEHTYSGILISIYDLMFDLKVDVDQCNIYFIVQ